MLNKIRKVSFILKKAKGKDMWLIKVREILFCLEYSLFKVLIIKTKILILIENYNYWEKLILRC
jgi:hypothetical protein